MSLYRNIAFLCFGLNYFTQSAFLHAQKSFNKDALNVDLAGKVTVVTGANSGLGKSTATELARRGAKVYMVCRDPERSEKARQEIVAQTGNQNVILKIVDMSSPREVVSFAQELAKEETRLDVLVNNAGCMVQERKETSDGLEVNFATNTVGTYALTLALLSLLKNQSEGQTARVITVSSGGMLTERLNVDDLNFEKKKPFDGTFAYAQNKRQQVILTQVWAKHYSTQMPVTFYSCQPGWADTPAVRHSMPGFYEKMKDRLRTEDQGADTIYWLAIAKKDEVEGKFLNGSFFGDRRPMRLHFPLAATHETPAEVDKLVSAIETDIDRICGKEMLGESFPFISKQNVAAAETK